MLPKQLMFTIGLVDQITKPIAKISKQFSGLASNYQAGTMKMASGIGGMAAAGYTLQKALMPAIEMDRALGEVKSLGVRDTALKQLTNTAYDFALQYGQSATDFVKSSYDIQSAIAGLNDADLSTFTLASNVLATATKADAATVTNYMGTMYGIFKNQAQNMGQGEWVKQVTGMTATAVQMFKTTGAGMSGAFTAIGAEATSAGIAMNEQMAILGTLQATMSGSEAGTKYKSFLAGVGKAQEQLGLTFTDAQGQMLPMVSILEKIKGKYGETISVVEGDELKKAFGSKEAVATIKLLMADINGLNGSINDLGKVKGMEQAEKMAAAMTDQSQRLSQSWFVIRAAFGTAILPVFNEFSGWLADVGLDLVAFTKQHPTLTKYIGYTAMALLGLVAAGGLFTLMMGAGQMAMTAWGAGAMVWAGINAALTSGLTFLRGAMLAVNIAMYANPIGLIVAAIAAAIAAVAALVYYWDDLKATMGEWGWIKAISGIFDSVWQGVKSVFTETLNWIIDKINMIPSVNIDLIQTSTSVTNQTNGANINKPIVPKELPNNVVPFKQSLVPETLIEQKKKNNNVTPFTQPIVPATLIEQQKQNNVVPFLQPIVPATLAEPQKQNNIVSFAQSIVPTEIAKETKNTRDLTSKPESIIKLPTLKAERTKAQPIFNNKNNNSNSNSSDNSRKVFIESINMKSDNPSEFIKNMLELTG